jgi:DNA-3-methyladenine glycosylase I
MTRCPWSGTDPDMLVYHDTEWGTPVHDDLRHFEFLVLEAAQAGLSWLTVLKKRPAYRLAYHGFQPSRVSRFTKRDVDKLLGDPGIIRNRAKIASSVKNARRFMDVQEEFGSFDSYLWGWVGGRPVVNRWADQKEVPARTELSDAVSADLKLRGFTFVGSTIMYSHLQAVGIVNDHLVQCFRHAQLTAAPRGGPGGRR